MYLSNVAGATYKGDGPRAVTTNNWTPLSDSYNTYLANLEKNRQVNQVNSPTTTKSPVVETTNNPYASFGDVNNYKTKLTDYNPNGATQGFNFNPSGAPLADINNYIGNSNPFGSWGGGEGGFDEAQFNTYNSFNGVPLYRKGAEGQWEINPEGRLAELNRQFPGLNFRLENDPYVEDYQDGRPSLQLKWDNSALPKDKFGRQGTSVDPVGFEDGRNGTMRVPQAVYDDPFYGRITDPRNLQQHQNTWDKFNEMLTGTPLLLSLAAGGLGSVLGGAGLMAGGLSPSTFMTGTQVVDALANGKLTWENAIPMLISAGFSLSGANEFLGKLAPFVRSGVTMGVNQIRKGG